MSQSRGSKRAVGALSVAVSAALALFLFWPQDHERPVQAKPLEPTAKSLPEIAALPTLTAVAIQLPPPPLPKPKPQIPKVELLKPAIPRAVLPKPQKPEIVEAVTPETVSEGRTLLRLLEHGKGPSIEIAWPAPANDQIRLYRLFTQCFGMKTAVMDDQQRLYVEETAGGESWDSNLDRYSGFMRRPVGLMSPQEMNAVRGIAQRHGLPNPIALRLFPRHVDAVLVGTLKRIVDDRYGSAKTIRARYRFQGPHVWVSDVEVDGHSLVGQLDLSAAAASRGTGCM
ncbi:MAG: hypothetical protein O3A84_06855 [Proteobacteria bacterium]|nr:hypothetical protein [Pseudomonadota bacterium]